MKKIVILMMMFLLGSILLITSPQDQQDLYIKAVSEKDPGLKIQLLKQLFPCLFSDSFWVLFSFFYLIPYLIKFNIY